MGKHIEIFCYFDALTLVLTCFCSQKYVSLLINTFLEQV